MNMNPLSATLEKFRCMLEEFTAHETAQSIADGCYLNLAGRLSNPSSEMVENQLRGYLRARSAVEIRRQIQHLVRQGRSFSDDLKRELYQTAAELLVQRLVNGEAAALQPVPALVERRAA